MRASDVDFSLLPEVITEVQEHVGELERDLHRLVQVPESHELLSSAFRHIHTIKGDFGYCNATPIVEFIHQLESIMQSLRSRIFQCSPLVAEALIQSMDQVQVMMEFLAAKHQYDPTPRTTLIRLIQTLGQARNQADADQAARHILLAINDEMLGERGEGNVMISPANPENIARARILGSELAAALARRHKPWLERTSLQVRLVKKLNQHFLYPVDSDALELATLWHDVGLLACPDACFISQPDENTPAWDSYAAHPELAATWLLAIAPDCHEAAQIIRQHHLGFNGAGIPAPHYPLPPHPAAMMLDCADLFFDRVSGLSGEEYRRGVLRSLFDVSAGFETRFDSSLISAFEAAARELVSGTGQPVL